jgi:hypothetical protein
VEAKQCIYERGFSSAVGAEQTNGAALQNARQTMKYRSAAELYFEPF